MSSLSATSLHRDAAPGLIRRRQRESVIAAAVFMALAAVAAAIFCQRYLWAWPDVPYLTQLTALPAIEAALNGDYLPLLDSYVHFNGEHRVGTYVVYLFLNARFGSYSTHVETVIWSLSILAQCAMYAYFIFGRLRVGLRSPAFAASLLLIPANFAPTFPPGRGMETQVQVSLTLLVGLMLLMTADIGIRRFTPAAILLSGVYTMGLAAAYFVPGTIAIAAGGAYFLIRGTSTRNERIRAGVLTGSLAVWGLIYIVTLKLYSTPNPAPTRSFGQQLPLDPLFIPKYLLRGLATTVTTINAEEYFGTAFWWITLLSGTCVTLVAVTLAVTVSRSHLARRFAALPIMLITYGAATDLAVMAGRYTDSYWPLNLWYGFQYRLPATGIILLAVLALQFRLLRRTRRSAAVLLAASAMWLLVVFGLSARWQWERNRFERVYFGDIREYVLHPEKSKARGDTLTPVYLDPISTERAIRFLKAYHLTPYD